MNRLSSSYFGRYKKTGGKKVTINLKESNIKVKSGKKLYFTKKENISVGGKS